MRRLPNGKRYGARRLKEAVVAAVRHRVRVCCDAEARYAAMSRLPNGGELGSVELAIRSEATERSARMEAELILRFVEDLPASGEPA